jgi:beta-N-acetylhexosaminidase
MTKTGADSAQLLRDAGAVLQVGFVGTTVPQWLRSRLAAGEVGGVGLFSRNIESRPQLLALNTVLRDTYPDVLIAIDEEGGDVNRLEVREGSSYPGNLALGTADDPALTEAVARSMGRDLSAVGVNLTYAPVADVNVNPHNPVIGVRSFGADGPLAARHTAAYVRGLQSTGVAACAKHFPGHGDTAGDSHLGLLRIDFDEVTEAVHLAPFRAAIAAGAKTIMTAHILFPRRDADLPATMSHAILTGLLRGELGYDGLIITDGIDMGAISGRYGVAEGTVKAIAAGADAICWGGSPAGEETFLHLRDALTWAVREGRLPAERLHEAAERNRAVARWSAAVRAEDTAAQDTAGQQTGERSIGLEAARRAIRVSGEIKPLTTPAHVIEFSPLVSIAVAGATAWGVAAPLAELIPGTTSARVSAPSTRTESVGLISAAVLDTDARVDIEPLLGPAVGRPLVLVVRDLHRNAWMGDAVDAVLIRRPDATVVEMGLPYGRLDELAARGVTVVSTFGAARVCGTAAAALLAEPGSAQ